MNVYLNIGGIRIEFDTRYPEYIRRRCARYLADPSEAGGAEGALHLRAEDADIERSDVNNVGPMEAELYAMTISLSEHLPGLGRLMTHGVAMTCGGGAYIFTAQSGVGKSTQAFLWQKRFGEDKVRIINGDKPILWLRDEGDVLACGSPWSGKEHLDENVCVPLKGICLLRRSSETEPPRIYPATREQTFDFMIRQVFIPSDTEAQMKTFELMEQLYERVPVYHLVADMSFESVDIAFSQFGL